MATQIGTTSGNPSSTQLLHVPAPPNLAGGSRSVSIDSGSAAAGVATPRAPRPPSNLAMTMNTSAGGVSSRGSPNPMMQKMQQMYQFRTDTDEAKASSVRKVHTLLAERNRKRFQNTVDQMKLHRKTKPPAPIPLQELEDHPLLKRNKHGTRSMREDPIDVSKLLKGVGREESDEEDEEEEEEEPTPFIVDPVTSDDVKATLFHEIGTTDLTVVNRRIRLPKPPGTAGSSGGEEDMEVISSPLLVKPIGKPEGFPALPPIPTKRTKQNVEDRDGTSRPLELSSSRSFEGGALTARVQGAIKFVPDATADGIQSSGAATARRDSDRRRKSSTSPPKVEMRKIPSPARRQSTVFHLTESGTVVDVTTHGSTAASLNSSLQRSSITPTTGSMRKISSKMGKGQLSSSQLSPIEPSMTPEAFLRLRGEKRHAQDYRRGRYQPPGVDTNVQHNSRTVKHFLTQLKLRSHEFNEANIGEIDRVRAAHRVFHTQKTQHFSEALENESLSKAPIERILNRVRQKIDHLTNAKDESDRLNVYYDHIVFLRRKALQLFPGVDVIHNAHDYLADVREVVTRRDGQQAYNDFVEVTSKYFPNEVLLMSYVEVFLAEVAPMFGMEIIAFRHWVEGVRRQYEERDMQSVFSGVEQRLGREIASDAKFRLTIVSARGLQLPPSPNKPAVFVKLSCERYHFLTKACHQAAPKWNEAFFMHVLNETSAVTLTLVIGSDSLPAGTFSVSQFAAGGKTKFGVSVASLTMPRAEIVVTIEIFTVRRRATQPPS